MNEVFTASVKSLISPEEKNGDSKTEVVPGLRDFSSEPVE